MTADKAINTAIILRLNLFAIDFFFIITYWLDIDFDCKYKHYFRNMQVFYTKKYMLNKKAVL